MTVGHALTERDIKVAQVLRLGTKPLSMQQARRASKLLDVHWTSVYRLRRRFLANPVASSVAPNARGRNRLDDQVEDIVDDVFWQLTLAPAPTGASLAGPVDRGQTSRRSLEAQATGAQYGRAPMGQAP
jgi:putative transposase